jgi:predicted  nucleic acid-binding Zn-ribbon protein
MIRDALLIAAERSQPLRALILTAWQRPRSIAVHISPTVAKEIVHMEQSIGGIIRGRIRAILEALDKVAGVKLSNEANAAKATGFAQQAAALEAKITELRATSQDVDTQIAQLTSTLSGMRSDIAGLHGLTATVTTAVGQATAALDEELSKVQREAEAIAQQISG